MMVIEMSKGSVSYRAPNWRGFFYWRAYPEGTPAGEAAGMPRRRKAVVLREYGGKPINAPTAKRPNLGRDTAKRALDEAKEAFAASIAADAARREAAEERRKLESPASSGLGGPTAAQMAAMDIPGFVRLVVDGLADGSIQKDGRALAASTIANYRSLLKVKLAPYFSGIAVRDLTPMQINAFKADMSRREREGEPGFSQTSRRKAFNLLQQAYGFAELWDVVERNPFRKTSSPAPAKTRPNPLDRRSIGETVRAVGSMPLTWVSVAFKLAMQAGLRRSEACGLRWGDVDLAAGELRVRRAVVDGYDGPAVRDSAKTESGHRTVPLASDLAGTLGRWRTSCEAEHASYGHRLSGSDYVLGGVDGRPMRPEKVTRAWEDFAEMYGITGTQGRRATYHDLRHTFVTLALGSGADVKSVSSMAGHASAAMTLDVYADAMPDAKRAAMDKASPALWPEEEPGRAAGGAAGLRDGA